jgi:hypothetical protein
MPANIDGVKLQLAMAFGQGAGHMQAQAEALERLLAEEGEVVSNAIGNWEASHWAFIELTRVLGQLSAARAAVGGSARIRWTDIEGSLDAVMVICPCFVRPPRQQAKAPR